MAPKRNSLLQALSGVVVSPSSLAYLLSKPLPPSKPLLRSFQELMHFPPFLSPRLLIEVLLSTMP